MVRHRPLQVSRHLGQVQPKDVWSLHEASRLVARREGDEETQGAGCSTWLWTLGGGSPHFGRWVAAELGPGEALWIPPGFAHGFQALEETYFLYLVTKEYDPQRDKCIRWDDPAIAVKWPAPDKAILSQKDRNCPPLAEAENNFKYPL